MGSGDPVVGVTRFTGTNSSLNSGTKFANFEANNTSALVPIAWTQLGSDTSIVTFSSLPQTFQDLYLVANARGTTAATFIEFGIRLNGDTGNNYSRTVLYGDGSATSIRGTNQPFFYAFYPIAASQTSNVFSAGVMHVLNYTSGSVNKTMISRDGVASSSSITIASVGLWRNSAAVTSLSITPFSGNIATGSTFALYGVRAA